MRVSAFLRGWVERLSDRVVDFSSRFAWLVIALSVLTTAGFGLYAKNKLELRTDLLELLPRDSPGFMAYEHQRGRIGGGAQLIVVAESPDPKANERFIDAIAGDLQAGLDKRASCVNACPAAPGADAARILPGKSDGRDGVCIAACGPELISYIESGTKDLHAFYQDNKWLYADMKELEEADNTLDRQVAIRSGLVEDLSEDEKAPAAGAKTANDAEKKPALGMDPYREKWEAEAKKKDDFPTGYFCTADGKMHGLRIVSMTTGMGDAMSERLLRQVDDIVKSKNPKSFHPQMDWGLAGDIANAQEEKESIASDALVATLVSALLILAGVIVYFRTPWALLVIGLPAAVGIASAYGFATATFGYVNTVGLFLGAIILGNGINYPIVLLGRYREFRSMGMPSDEARRAAVRNAFRAELVGASVAAVAYGSLSVTHFRGFSQFGIIGFVGMFLVWLSIIPIVPAMVTVIEQLKLPFWEPKKTEDGSSGPVMRWVARVTERRPVIFLAAATIVTLFFAAKSVAFLKDPWEYSFHNLGSSRNVVRGAGYWSNRADAVFGGKMNIAGAQILADQISQVDALKAQILANDAKDADGQLVEKVVAVWDALPGTTKEQDAKLEVLERIRSRLTPRVLESMDASERKKLEDMRPPERLKILEPKDLPPIIRRRFTERDGRIGTIMYVKFKDVVLSDGRIALRISKTADNVTLPDGTVVQTASHSTIYAEMLRSMRRDGPLATFLSFALVAAVVVLATSGFRGAVIVLLALLMGIICTLGGASLFDAKIHYINFIAFPITFGIGCEYPFNVFDRSRLLNGDVIAAVKRTAGAITLCSYTTIVGYGALIFNDFQALRSFGKLAVAGEFACIVAALFVVPSLLHIWKVRKPTS